jgi:hypothetical protein
MPQLGPALPPPQELGAAGRLGPAAAAGNAKVNISAAVISRLKNPIFFMPSSSSEFSADAASEINAHGPALRS